MNKSTHTISLDVELNLRLRGAPHPGIVRAMYEVPALIIAASRVGGFTELPLLPGQTEVCEGIKSLLTADSDNNAELVKIASSARQIHVRVFAEKPIIDDWPELQLHINFIRVGGRNIPFFQIQIVIGQTGSSRLLKVWRE